MRCARVLLGILLGAACGPVTPRQAEPPRAAPSRIVAAERGRGGTFLVFVDEDGRRVADLTRMPDEDAGRYRVDAQPVWSPDGRFVAFASTRGRADQARTSLWLIEALPGGEPRRLTTGPATDRDPAWTADGRSIVFASDRGGSFDLWRLSLAAPGEPQRLTATPADEVSPSVGPRGELVYAVVDRDARTSTLWRAEATGAGARQLTAGPLDRDPAVSTDGAWVAFAAPAAGRADLDLHRVRLDGSERGVVADEPLADERAPVWSADGRFLFAVAELRAEQTGRAFFASVVHVSPDAVVPTVRALHDPVIVPRVGVALAPEPLTAQGLAGNPVYDRDTILAALRDLCQEADADDAPEVCAAVRE